VVIKVATIALSPETTCGTATEEAWDLSEALMKKLLRPGRKWPRLSAKRPKTSGRDEGELQQLQQWLATVASQGVPARIDPR
jgi:hypothetical protein